MPLRVMTYNIRAARGMDGRLNLDRIARVIAAEAPDIVALQEVDSKRRRTRHLDQAQELASRLGYHHAFVAAHTWPDGEYGNALLSRYPVVDCQRICLPRPGRLPVETRCLMLCRIATPLGDVRIWNTHLGLFAGERRAQIALLIQQLANDPDIPLVLCGDFNARAQSKEIRGLSPLLQRVPSQRTYPGILPVVTLDHVFHSAQLRSLNSFVARNRLARQASDHLPLVVDFDWEPPLED